MANSSRLKNLASAQGSKGEGGTKMHDLGRRKLYRGQGQYARSGTVSITDYTGSINLKIRPRKGRTALSGRTSPKALLRWCGGDCSYDKYVHDYIVYLTMVLVVEAREKREDMPRQAGRAAPYQIVSMDGFSCDPGGIVKLLVFTGWGTRQ